LPSELFEQRDTLIIGGYCKRTVYLVSAGVPNDYYSTARCNISVRATTVDINTRGLYAYPAYPNPAATLIFTRAQTSGSEQVEGAALYDLMGQMVSAGVVETGSIEDPTKKSKTINIGFDIRSLPDGVYTLCVRGSLSVACQVVVIRK